MADPLVRFRNVHPARCVRYAAGDDNIRRPFSGWGEAARMTVLMAADVVARTSLGFDEPAIAAESAR